MKFNIDIDKNMIEEVEMTLGSFAKQTPSIMQRALNRAVTNANSNIKKEIRARYHIKAGDISDTLKVKKATSSNLGAYVKSSGGVIALDKFKVSPKTVNPKRKKPIKVAVKKSGAKDIMGAFIADISGAKVFKRSGDERLPIEKLFGPSVPQMLGSDEVRSKIQSEAEEMLRKRLDHEITRMIERR